MGFGRTYVGFGFGAIQAGLFLYEAHCSGAFDRLMVAEVVPEAVAAVREAGGCYTVNIAHADRVEQAAVSPVQIGNPTAEGDRAQLIDAVAEAAEIGTAVPGVSYYTGAGPASISAILAAGLRRKAARDGPRAVVYAAENHNHAAEILEAAVMAEIPEPEQAAVRARVRFLNTVIGKMSGVVTGAGAIQEGQMAPMTPGGTRAFLVEAFNRILISQIDFDDPPGAAPFRRGIQAFEEKPDLLPFEEAKLYGHNATHALAAYLGYMLDVRTIAELPSRPGVMPFLRAAFLEESGAALIKKYAGLDPLFTPEGYAAYADDLLVRMVNPNLLDTVERVGRDPARKLAWDDRLIGTMRMAQAMGIRAERYALGSAAALAFMAGSLTPPGAESLPALLGDLWANAGGATEAHEAITGLIAAAAGQLARWAAAGFPDLEMFWRTLAP